VHEKVQHRCAIGRCRVLKEGKISKKKGGIFMVIPVILAVRFVLSIYMVLGFAVLHALVPPLVACLKLKERGE
jgi:hypothetical protein